MIGAIGVAGASPESDKLFHEGKDLLKAGKLAEACDAFARSQELLPRVGTLLNLGDCREKQGQTATAWAVFLEAKVLASRSRDKSDALMPAKLAEATKRAAALQLELAYVTLTIAPDRRVEGLVIKRNGTVVDPATWNTPVPLDPGDYVIEASAPKHQPWSITQPLSPRERVAVVVEVLVAEPVVVAAVPLVVPLEQKTPPDTRIVPSAPADGITLPALPHKGPAPRFRPLGIGVALASCPNCNVGLVDSQEVEESDTLVGARILGGVAVPGGMVRGIGSLLYSKFLNDKTDASGVIRRYSFGLSVDYVWTPRPQIAFAGGVGIGIDYLSANDEVFDDGLTETTRWTTLRASPIIVRLLNGHVELGLHLQLVSSDDNTAFLGVAAIDVFPL